MTYQELSTEYADKEAALMASPIEAEMRPLQRELWSAIVPEEQHGRIGRAGADRPCSSLVYWDAVAWAIIVGSLLGFVIRWLTPLVIEWVTR